MRFLHQSEPRYRRVLVRGTSVEVAALRHVLVLLPGIELWEPSSIVLDDLNPNGMHERGTLSSCHAVIAFTENNEPARFTYQLVHQLRTQASWMGVLIVVVPHPIDATRVRRVPLSADKHGTRFGDVPAHVVLKEPVRLPDLARLLFNSAYSSGLSRSFWYLTVLRSGAAARLPILLDRLATLLANDRYEDARKVISTTVQALQTVDWLVAMRNDVDVHVELPRVRRWLEAAAKLDYRDLHDQHTFLIQAHDYISCLRLHSPPS